MTIRRIVSAKLHRFLERSKAERIIVAYSGGADSTVLLHLLKDLPKELHCKTYAVHINHQLHPAADNWATHCLNQAKQLGIAFQSLKVQISHTHTQGLESAAREARYDALQGIMNTNDLLVTAHHRNDQAETVLLRLLRGTGTAGIAGIAEYQTLDKGTLARPMLSIARADIRSYAQENRLDWLEDPSNEDLKHERNYLRHCIIPRLSERWPKWHRTVARYADHRATAEIIIDTEIRQCLLRCLLPGSSNLLLRVFITLPTTFRSSVLREWCKLNDIVVPNAHQLVRICDAILIHINKHNCLGGGIIYACADARIGAYHGMLYAIKPQAKALSAPIKWHRDSDCEIPQLNLKLRRTELMRQAPSLCDKTLSVDFRRGDEQCACVSRLGERFHKSLKNIFQEHRIPTWQRDQIPLIYEQGRLRLIWNITECG